MYVLYSLFLTLASIILLPYFVYQAFVNKKYLSNFRERLGRLPETLTAERPPAIWLHAVSVGETLAARPLITALRGRFPQHRLIVSTTTTTGQTVARSRIAEADGFCYFPFDWPFAVRRALSSLQPQIVILMESELWPNFLRECGRRRIPVLVANGRISDRSWARWQRFRWLVRRMLGDVTHFAMQSEISAERAIALGAPPERVSVSGNLKYDIGEVAEGGQLEETAKELSELLALGSAPLIIAGSTCDGEEEILLAAFEQVRKRSGFERVRLLIAPRHPERFEAVARLLDSTRLRWVRRSAYAREAAAATALSDSSENHSSDFRLFTAYGRRASSLKNSSALPLPALVEAHSSEVILLDSIGELAALYATATVVFVGGSLVPKGGHNILEPAFYARPIIVGPHMENFREIAETFAQRDALISLRGTTDQELIEELRDTLIALLQQPERACRLGERARAVVEEHRGATAHTVAVVARLIG
jgi:3-deoxy-D-manno-octulosonic-acid transferase